MSRTVIDLDDDLVAEVAQALGTRTKKDTVNTALREVLENRRRALALTRLREAGMALEAVQAQAGHASIESTRIYLHLADDWLAAQYRKAAEVIDAQVFAGQPAGARSQR